MAIDISDFINMARSKATPSIHAMGSNSPLPGRGPAGGQFGVPRGTSGRAFGKGGYSGSESSGGSGWSSRAKNGGMGGFLPMVQTPDGGRASIADQDEHLGGVAGTGSSSPNRNEDEWNVGIEGRRERHQPVDPQTRRANQAKSTIEAAIGNIASKMQRRPPVLENIAGNINRNISDLFPDQYYEIAGKFNPGWGIANGISPLEDFRAEGPRHIPVATDYDPNTLSRYVDYDYAGGMNDFMKQTYPRRLRTSDVYGNEGAYHPRIDPDSEAGQLARLIESGEVNADPKAVWNLLPDGGLVYHHGLMPDEGTKEDFRQAMQREVLKGNPFGQARPIVGPSLKWFQIPEYPNIIPREPILPYQDEDDMYIYGRG